MSHRCKPKTRVVTLGDDWDPPNDPRWQAQDLAYQAMEFCERKDVLRLVRKALKFGLGLFSQSHLNPDA